MYFVYTFQKIKTIRPHVCIYTLHSDEVVSLIAGDDSVVGSPMQSGCYIRCVVILLIYIDIYPRISLVSVLKNG